jgi:hypothetical protein
MKHTLAELEEYINVLKADIGNKDGQIKVLREDAREQALNTISKLQNIIAICNQDIRVQIDIIQRME